jgi:hypothetical protein
MATPDAQWARDTGRAAIQSLAEGDPARQLDVLSRLPASRLRAEMCGTAIKALAEKDSAAAEARLILLPEARQRARVQSEILGKLAARDPNAGLARLAALAPDLRADMSGTLLVTTVLRAAGTKDATAALATVDELPEDLQRVALGSALVGWAGEHPVDALTWAAANGVQIPEAKAFMSYGDGDGVSWNSLLSTAFGADNAKTLAWLRAQPASRERDSMLCEGIWSGKAEENFQIYAELTRKGQADAAGEVVRRSFEDGDGDVEPWVKAQPPGAARQAAIQEFVSCQAGNTPERIDALVDAWPAGPDRDAAMRGIVSSLSATDPRRALDFARRVSGTAARESAFESIARDWLYRDQPAAGAWIVGAPELSAEEKRVLLRQAAER